MKRFTFAGFGLLLAAVSFALPALAETAKPSAGIRGIFDQVRVIVMNEKTKLTEEALDNKLKDIIVPMFDFEEMSRRSLGAYWSKATPDEQHQFVELFSDLLARTYLKRIKRNAEDSVIKEMTDDVDQDKAMVKSVVLSNGEEIAIDYRLLLQGGSWKIYDVVIENVGLVSNYRNEFPAIIRKEGFPGLIARLREKKVEPAKV